MNRTVRGLQGQRYRSFRPSEQLFYGEILYRPNFSRPTLTIDLRVFRDVIPKGVSADPKWQKAFEFDRSSVLQSPRQFPAVHHLKKVFPKCPQSIPKPDFKTARMRVFLDCPPSIFGTFSFCAFFSSSLGWAVSRPNFPRMVTCTWQVKEGNGASCCAYRSLPKMMGYVTKYKFIYQAGWTYSQIQAIPEWNPAESGRYLERNRKPLESQGIRAPRLHP